MEWIWIAVAVIAVLIVLALFRRPKDPMLPTTLSSTPLSTDAHIDQLLRDGKKIHAIKVLRDATPGLSLEDAKHRIDHWHTRPTATSARTTATATATAPGDDAFPPELIAEIDRLIADGQRIQAVKTVREHTGWGLKESKTRIDRWVPGQG